MIKQIIYCDLCKDELNDTEESFFMRLANNNGSPYAIVLEHICSTCRGHIKDTIKILTKDDIND